MVKKIILIVSIFLIATVIFFIESKKNTPTPNSGSENGIKITEKSEKKSKYPLAKEITTPNGFINTDSISIADLIGKEVILLDFWTYSCINCQRTTPYLNAWHDKYKDNGLTIIGLHTPEFEFEKEYENVRSAVERFNINYPVVLDNDFSTWYAYNNRYWPRKYLIDIDGYIVYDHIGEGAYAETESIIQKLLQERNQKLTLSNTIDMSVTEIANAVTPAAKSPEIYFGAWRNEYIGNGTSKEEGVAVYSIPQTKQKNTYYLDGEWDTTYEFTENKSKNAKIYFIYEARNVNLVGSSENLVTVEVRIDGQSVPVKLRGKDIYENKGKTFTDVHEDKLYELIRDETEVGIHELELEVLSPGLRAYTYTFG